MPRRTRPSSSLIRGLATLGFLLSAPLAPSPAAAEPLAEDTVLLRIGPGDIGILTLPRRASPETRRPVVLVLPDSDGAGPRSGVYGQRLLDNGYAVLEVDFGGGDPDGPLSGPPIAARLGLALAGIAAEPRLDPGQVAVVGLGEGARAALFGLGAAPGIAVAGSAVAGIAALALLYPGCDAALAEAAPRIPARPHLLLLHGDEDAANDASACAALAGAFPAQDRVRHRVLSGASYGWDAGSLVRPGGAALLPHPAAGGRRVWSQPDPLTATVAADRVLGLVVAALGRW